MARANASIMAAMLFGIAACTSTPDSDTLHNRNRNLEGTIQAQRQRIDQLVAKGKSDDVKIKALEAANEKHAATTDVVETAKKEISDHVAAVIQRFRADSAIKIEQASGGYRFVLTERVLFESGQTEIKPDGKKALLRVATALNGTRFPVMIEGHTDAVPVATEATLKRFPLGNIELSAARALAVWKFLVDEGKVAKRRLSIIGHGPNRPRAGNETEFERWHNRRVEIMVLEQ